MKERELRERAVCDGCGEKVFNSGVVPLFWTVKVQRHGLLVDVVKRQAGLEMMTGSVAIAQVLGPDEDMTKPMGEEVDLTLCETCAMKPEPIAGHYFNCSEPRRGDDD